MVNMKVLRVYLLIIIFGGIIYSNTFHNSFHFDDLSFILNNPAITTLGRPMEIFKYWPSRFIGLLSFALNYRIHKFSLFGYHLINIVAHSLTACLAFWFASLTFSTPVMIKNGVCRYKEFISFFVAAIFLTHPLQTQPVNYIFQRVTILVAFFYLASLCLYVKAMLPVENENKINKFYYLASLIAAFIGMFAKENMFTLPVMILAYDFYFLQTKKSLKWKYILPFFILLPFVPLAVSIAKPIVFTDIKRLLDNPWITSTHYLWTTFRVMVTYFRLLLFPIRQNLDYDYPIAQSFLEVPVLASFLILVLLVGIGIRLFPKYRLMSFGIFWIFLTLLPESSIIPLLDVICEHRLYLPLIGYSLFVVGAAYYFFRDNKFKIAMVFLSLIVVLHSIITYNRNCVWENEFSLWNDVVKKSPKKVRPYNERGLAYLDRGEYDFAIIDFTQAVRLNKDYADGYHNRGIAYQKKGEYNKAILDYSEAIKINPKYLNAYINRGIANYQNKEYEKSAFDFNKAIELGYKAEPKLLEWLKPYRKQK